MCVLVVNYYFLILKFYSKKSFFVSFSISTYKVYQGTTATVALLVPGINNSLEPQHSTGHGLTKSGRRSNMFIKCSKILKQYFNTV